MDTFSVQNIHKQFGQKVVLQGLSLSAQSGDVISIIGSSGSGKSTFLRCMNLLERPNEGSIILKGESLKLERDKAGELHAADLKQLQRFRTRLSMVFQHFNLWSHLTVLENIIEAPIRVLGLSREAAQVRAQTYLAKVGLSDVESRYPVALSGGQQQRVAIARALAMEPDVLLFDEPTSALDPELVNDVLKVMRALAAEGRTMIVVTHEMAFAREVSNKILFLHQGKIEEQGDPKIVLANPQSARLQQFLSGNLK
ncbi:MAG: ATP-binding cassette domain-containing protein [Neisseriaceae bacterium]|nr:ATP-binding cassette domain-containing protein [Neisseriaceae bacterium]